MLTWECCGDENVCCCHGCGTYMNYTVQKKSWLNGGGGDGG